MTNDIVIWVVVAAVVTAIWMTLLYLVIRGAIVSALRDTGLARVKPAVKPAETASDVTDAWS